MSRQNRASSGSTSPPDGPKTFAPPTALQLSAAVGTTITDIIAPDLDVLFVGINPSIYSAAVGHHFARPGNRFWPALHAGGFTPRRLHPAEDHQLLEYGCGLTNVADRATARADEVSLDELALGGRNLLKKIRRYRPRFVALVGITAYRAAFDRPKADIGPQPEPLGTATCWVLPNPSGLNAHYQLPELGRLFGRLRTAVQRERKKSR